MPFSVSRAWSGPIMSLYWKRANKYGTIAGMLSGGIMVFVWKYLVRPMGGVWDLYELAPAFLVAIIMIVVVSLVTAAPDDEMVRKFEHVSKMS